MLRPEATQKISEILAELTGIDASWHWPIAFQAALEAEQTAVNVKSVGLQPPPMPDHIIEELV